MYWGDQESSEWGDGISNLKYEFPFFSFSFLIFTIFNSSGFEELGDYCGQIKSEVRRYVPEQ